MLSPTYDPLKPFIAEDGLEYDDLAAYICNEPQDTERNFHIEACRAAGQPEKRIREWIKRYDGSPEGEGHAERKKDADFAIYPAKLDPEPVRIDCPF